MDSKSHPFQGWGLGTPMKPVDNLWTTRRVLRLKPVDNSPIVDKYLTISVRSLAIAERLKACCSRVHYSLTPALCLLLGVMTLQMQPAQAKDADTYKLYAHSRIVDYQQYECFVKIINKENRSWDVNARNGSHFGLGQMRSEHYRNLDGYRQIDMIIKYIKARYKTACRAWSFHQKKNYF